MKKFFLVLASLVFASSAFAQEGQKAEGPTFKYNVWANAFYRNQSTTTKDQVYSYSNIRVRPKFTASLGNVSVVTRLEIDQTYGEIAKTTQLVDSDGDDVDVYTSDSSSGIDVGADNKVVEVKNIYINVKDMIVPGLSVKTGAAGYDFPMAFSDDCGLFELGYNAGVAKVSLAYVQAVEGTTSDRDDEYFYAAKVGIKAGPATIMPGLLYAVEETADQKDKTITVIGLDVKANMGPLGIKLTSAYGTGSNDSTKKDYSGLAADLDVSFKVMPMLTVGAFVTYYSGDDSSTTDEDESFSGLGLQVENSNKRMFILQDASSTNQVGLKANGSYVIEDDNAGLIMYGIGAKFKMDKISGKAYLAMATAADDTTTANVGEDAYGVEFDLHVGYAVAPKSTLYAEFGILSGPDALGADAENPTYYAFGLKTSI